jgi:hypothetical protein
MRLEFVGNHIRRLEIPAPLAFFAKGKGKGCVTLTKLEDGYLIAHFDKFDMVSVGTWRIAKSRKQAWRVFIHEIKDLVDYREVWEQ